MCHYVVHKTTRMPCTLNLFIYLEFYITFNTVQVISRQVVGRAEETSTYSWSRFCTVNCLPMASKYQLSHLRCGRELNPGLRGGRRECYHSATVTPTLAHSMTIEYIPIIWLEPVHGMIYDV